MEQRPWLRGDKNPARRPEVRAKISASLKGRSSPKSAEWRRKNSTVIKGLAKQKVDTGWKNSKLSEINRQKVGRSNPFWGRHHSLESIAKMVRSKQANGDVVKLAQRNADPEFQRKRLRACVKRPNKREVVLRDLLQAHWPGEWKYVGNGEVVFGTKCPDFINVNGQKLLIELYGTYWHRGQDPIDRIRYFKQYGFATLVVWESELDGPDTLVARIQSWIGIA